MTQRSAADVQAIVRRGVGIAVRPDFEIVGLGVDSADLRLPFTPGMTRLGDTISGPVLMAAADAAMYAAIVAHVPGGEYAVTSHFHIDFLRRPRAADVLARATILHCGRRSVACRVELFSGSDRERLVAHVSGAYARTAGLAPGAAGDKPL